MPKVPMPLLRDTINKTNEKFKEFINTDNKKRPMPIIPTLTVPIILKNAFPFSTDKSHGDFSLISTGGIGIKYL